MSKFSFLNSEERYLTDCTPVGIGLIHMAFWADKGLLEVLHDDGRWRLVTCGLYQKSIYRVLAKPYTLEDHIEKIRHECGTNNICDSLETRLVNSAIKLAASLGDK